MRSKANAGFTLVELVCILVIVGSLASIAVPAYQDISTAARDAVMRSTAASLRGGVDGARLRWRLASGTGAVTNLSGYGAGTADFNSSGYLVGTAYGGALSNDRCVEVFSTAMQPAPSVVAYSGSDTGYGNTVFAARYIAGVGCAYYQLKAGSVVLNDAGIHWVYLGYDPNGELMSAGTIWHSSFGGGATFTYYYPG